MICLFKMIEAGGTYVLIMLLQARPFRGSRVGSKIIMTINSEIIGTEPAQQTLI